MTPFTFISTPSRFGWQPPFISPRLKPSTSLMMCNYLGVCVRWKLISPCQARRQAWHEFSCPGPTVCLTSEKPSGSTISPWGTLSDRVQEVKWLWLFPLLPPSKRKSATMLSKCKLEAGLLCATLTQHWHSTVRLAGWVGTVESAGSGWMSSTLVRPQSSSALNSPYSRMDVLVLSAGLKSLFLGSHTLAAFLKRNVLSAL